MINPPHSASTPRPVSEGRARQIDALSPRRLALLTGAFLAVIAALFFVELRDERAARRELVLAQVNAIADRCARAALTAIGDGALADSALSSCHPGGRVALFHFDDSGRIAASMGPRPFDILPEARESAASLGESHLVRAASARRSLGEFGSIVVATPWSGPVAGAPFWIEEALIFAAVAVVIIALMAAFLRQSAAAAEAVFAIDSLAAMTSALKAGRASPWRFDAARESVILSRAVLTPLGLGDRDRAISLRELAALVHPLDLRKALAIFAAQPASTADGALRFRTAAGAWSRLYVRAASDPVAGRCGVAIDLSPDGDAAPGLVLAEARLKDAIESISDAFVLWDAQGRLAAWNRRFAAILRLPTKALHSGMSVGELADLAADRGAIVRAHFAPGGDVDEPSEISLPGDRWIRISRRVTGEGGLVCVASSVTDARRRARTQLRKERELHQTVADLETSRAELSEAMRRYAIEKHRAEDANRSKSEFLARMSHELRTPLNAINGFTEIMQAELYGPLGDNKYKEYVADILGSGRHLLQLIDDMLDMSKVEAGRVEVDPRRIDLEKLLKESARLLAKRAAESGVTLTTAVRHAPTVYADPRAAKQVLLNLLSNAVKFTPSGGDVTITVDADLDGVTVLIADSGAGIEKSQLGRLGAPFERGRDAVAAGHPGSGIGLALSNSLMELQGGILALASAPGKGTIAAATFPRRKGAPVRLPAFLREDAHVLTGRDGEKTAPTNDQDRFRREAAE